MRDWQAPLGPYRGGYGSRSTVEIECRVARYMPEEIGVVTGAMEEKIDPETGEITDEPKVFWLPRSLIKIAPGKGNYVVVTVPLWKAKRIGLI